MSIYRGKTKNEVYLASLLYDAIEDQDLSSVKTLIRKGADANIVLPKKKIAPFHLIIGIDSEKFALEVATLILQHGGNPNVPSDDGLTPVHIAAAWGRVDILKLLLQSGGDPEVRDLCNKTPLHYALEEKFNDCYVLLQSYLPDKTAIMTRNIEDCNNYDVILDKIVVNNGTTVGEYEIVNEYKTDSIYKKDLQKLKELPQSNSNEYVINWFNSQTKDATPHQKIINSSASSSTGLSEDSDESLKESDRESSRFNIDTNNICFRKVYRKKSKTPRKTETPSKIKTFTDNSSYVAKEYSEISGLELIPIDSLKHSPKINKDASSDYATCESANSATSLNALEKNIFEMTEDNTTLMTSDDTNQSAVSVPNSVVKSEGISSIDASFVSVSEIYKYIDKEEGIVLYERRFLKTPLSDKGSVKSFSTNLTSLPETIDYEDCDSDKIRNELTTLGYNPGPITVTTKRIYLKKLRQLKKNPHLQENIVAKKAYSLELERTLKNPDWLQNMAIYKSLDDQISTQFGTPDPSKKWREGVNKSSFTYLLLDPRITNNLPARSENLQMNEIWETFISAIFYVGKGKRSRPYSHLYDAVTLWNEGKRTSQSEKLTKIINIWEDNYGVVCLHLFQNTIPVEAYTREAAIIQALKISNLCNIKKGDFYGIAATWSQKEKSMLGVFLLYKALMIFLHEGERQLCPSDID